jgi:hypothetical protein
MLSFTVQNCKKKRMIRVFLQRSVFLLVPAGRFPATQRQHEAYQILFFLLTLRLGAEAKTCDHRLIEIVCS